MPLRIQLTQSCDALSNGCRSDSFCNLSETINSSEQNKKETKKTRSMFGMIPYEISTCSTNYEKYT